MKIRIVADGRYTTDSADLPQVGRVYVLEDAENGTNAQNKAFHAILGEYWKSGQHSYQVKDFDSFRDVIKRNLGAGFESFVYADIVDGAPKLVACKTKAEIPVHVMQSPHRDSLVRGRLKSWSDYTKKERRETMDKLISEMHQAGVQSKKFHEILEGMGQLWQ